MDWTEAVLAAIKRYSKRHHTRVITRQSLIREELDQIKRDTSTIGRTPSQTLSRELQELRDAGTLYFANPGEYVLLDTPIDVDNEDLTDEVLEAALEKNKLRIGNIPTSDEQIIARRRKGQSLVRSLTLRNYNSRCALCDVTDKRLLVASHIVRWADSPEFRGDLSNVICLCRFHDALFEPGYIAFTDDLRILKKRVMGCKTIELNQDTTGEFRLPHGHRPSPEFLKAHRYRSGFESVPEKAARNK